MKELFQSIKSVVNTTTTPLNSNQTFTGVFEQNVYPDVMISCQTDVSGTLFFDFSVDGVNSSSFPSNGFDISAGVHEFHSAVKGPRYFRVRLLNNGSNQSYLRLYTYFGQYRQSSSPLNQILSNDADATVVRTVNTDLDIAAGRFSGTSAVNKFGRATDGVQTTSTDIWDRANGSVTQQVWTAPTTNRYHTLSSTSAADTGGGAGARTVNIFGLVDLATAETSETITLFGGVSSTTVNKYVIVHRMRVVTTGTNGFNIGNILCTAGTDQTVTAQINSQNGTTLMAIYGVPSTQKLYVQQWRASINKAGGAVATIIFKLMQNPEPAVQSNHFNIIGMQGAQSTGNSSPIWPFTSYVEVAGPSILKISAEASANGVDATAQFGALLLDN